MDGQCELARADGENIHQKGTISIYWSCVCIMYLCAFQLLLCS